MQVTESLRAAAISGSPSHASRSRMLLQHGLAILARQRVAGSLLDLAELPADDLLGRTRSGAITEALQQVADAHIVLVATPVYRASYSGLLKTFFDLLPAGALAGKVAVLVATGGAPGHQLVLDHALRPLVASLNGLSAPAGVFAIDSQFSPEGPTAALCERLESALLQAIRLSAACAPELSPVT
ncbi:MAG: NAD(P)H-dependent oxidoreductase [Longimicrobiales bacterium]